MKELTGFLVSTVILIVGLFILKFTFYVLLVITAIFIYFLSRIIWNIYNIYILKKYD